MGLEEQLCALLTRWPLSSEAERKSLSLLEQPLAWDRFLDLVRAYEILPLVTANLKRLCFPRVPAAIQSQLEELFRANAVRNLLLADELARVLSRLAEAHVPAIPLKGVALAESLYGDAALRVCADLDLLVAPQHFAAAFDCLISAGYAAEFSSTRLVALTARHGKDLGLMRQDGSSWYPVQLHAGLIWGGRVERAVMQEIWRDARAADFHGAPALALSPEWEFLYLAVHAARHGASQLKWLADIDQLCRRGSLDWQRVREVSRRLKWDRVIGEVLAASRDLLETPVPAALDVPARRATSPRPAASESSIQPQRDTLFSLRLLPSTGARFRFACARLFIPTPADLRWLRLPAPLFFLYYGTRPLRLAVNFAKQLLVRSAVGAT
jgi:hypothetical protein